MIKLTRDICTRFFIKKKKNICDQRLSDDWVIRTRRSLRRPIIPEAINARNIRVYYVPDVYAWGEVKSSGSKGKDGSSVCLQSIKVKMQNSCRKLARCKLAELDNLHDKKFILTKILIISWQGFHAYLHERHTCTLSDIT